MDTEGCAGMRAPLGGKGANIAEMARLGLTYSEITKMQSRAILEAAVAVVKEGIEVKPEIMIP